LIYDPCCSPFSQKTSFKASKWPRKLKTAKNSKLPKLPETCFGPVGEGGWPPISTWITFTPTDIVYIFRILPQVTYLYSSEFFHLVQPLAQLIPDLVIPLTLDLVTWLRPFILSYTLQPRAVLSPPISRLRLCTSATSPP
jgi:hypothetical protein